MLDKVFASRLSRLSSKKKDDQVVQEFVLSHVSMDPVQMFLQPLDEEYSLFLRHIFTTNQINWKKVMFELHIPFLQIEFDALKMNATLVGINVSHKVLKEGEVFKYDLIFHKEHDPEIDSVFAITFLNRKEEDEDGKKDFLWYNTNVTVYSRGQTAEEVAEEITDLVEQKEE